MNETKIAEILKSFEIFDGIYKREQIDAAIQLKEEITPYLIEILEDVLAKPAEYTDNQDYYAHIYALYLLGNFREHRAHKVIIDLFSLPGDIPSDLFGDTVTEDLSVILYRTCGGSIELIKSLILNNEAYEYCRASSLEALEFAVAECIIQRDEIITFLGSIVDNKAEYDYDFLSHTARSICHLYPEELMDKVKITLEDELIDRWLIGENDFERALDDGKEKCLERIRTELQRRSLDNLHKSMSSWACFKSEPKRAMSPATSPKTSTSNYNNKLKKKTRNKTKKQRQKAKKKKKSKKKKRR